jgi:hypothetical protein
MTPTDCLEFGKATRNGDPSASREHQRGVHHHSGNDIRRLPSSHQDIAQIPESSVNFYAGRVEMGDLNPETNRPPADPDSRSKRPSPAGTYTAPPKSATVIDGDDFPLPTPYVELRRQETKLEEEEREVRLRRREVTRQKRDAWWNERHKELDEMFQRWRISRDILLGRLPILKKVAEEDDYQDAVSGITPGGAPLMERIQSFADVGEIEGSWEIRPAKNQRRRAERAEMPYTPRRDWLPEEQESVLSMDTTLVGTGAYGGATRSSLERRRTGSAGPTHEAIEGMNSIAEERSPVSSQAAVTVMHVAP